VTYSEHGVSADIEFRLLGPVEAWIDGERRALGGRRQQKVLAALLLSDDRLVSSDTLVDALWDEDPPATARKQVHNAISALRRSLEPAQALIVTDGTCYRVDIPARLVDVRQFAEHISAATARVDAGDGPAAITLLTGALALWRGQALAGLTGRFAQDAATRLAEQRLTARELLMDLQLAEGESGSLVPELRALLSEHPLRERVAGQLMLALYRDDRQSDALYAYERIRERLADELGIDPGTELRTLHERILRADPSLRTAAHTASIPARPTSEDRAAPCALPRDIPDFTGRTDEITGLMTAAHSTHETAVVITAVDGMAGIGKTTLAVRTAHLCADQYPDGQLFVDLHGHTPGQQPVTPAAALDVLLRSLAVPPEHIPGELAERADRWRSELVGRRVLVVLDNAADPAQLHWLLPGSPGVTVLITSRRRMSALDGALSLSLGLPTHDEAVRLFAVVVGDDRPTREAERTAEVVRSCGLLPLAIRIAGSRLRHRPAWTVGYLADRLADERRTLAELSTGERGVLTAFNVSYQHLDHPHRRMFRLLGLHPGPDGDAYAAAALAEVAPAEAETLLEELLDVNLLMQQQAERYAFHDLVRKYALHMVRTQETEADQRLALQRLARYFLDLARSCDRLLHPSAEAATAPSALPALRTPAEATATVAREHANLAAMVAAALAHHLHEVAWRLALTAGPLLFRCGHGDEALQVFDHGLTAARAEGVRQAEASLLRSLGVARLGMARFDDALQALHDSLAIARALAVPQDIARILSNIGIVHIRRGAYEQALTHLHEAHELLADGPNPFDRAPVLANLGVALTKLGRYREAAQHHFDVLAIVEPRDNRYAEMVALLNVGWTYTLDGQLAEGADHLRRALDRSREIGVKEAEARSLYSLAECLRQQGELDEALRHGRAGLLVAREIGDVDVEIDALTALGNIRHAMADQDGARDCYDNALWLIARSGQTYKAAAAREGLGIVAAAQGKRVEAVDHWRAALTLATEAHLPDAARIAQRIAEDE
jgi:DNA-binding SARP family transcriptional activator/tetratricopeptide (TPR) repeat protein